MRDYDYFRDITRIVGTTLVGMTAGVWLLGLLGAFPGAALGWLLGAWFSHRKWAGFMRREYGSTHTIRDTYLRRRS